MALPLSFSRLLALCSQPAPAFAPRALHQPRRRVSPLLPPSRRRRWGSNPPPTTIRVLDLTPPPQPAGCARAEGSAGALYVDRQELARPWVSRNAWRCSCLSHRQQNPLQEELFFFRYYNRPRLSSRRLLACSVSRLALCAGLSHLTYSLGPVTSNGLSQPRSQINI